MSTTERLGKLYKYMEIKQYFIEQPMNQGRNEGGNFRKFMRQNEMEIQHTETCSMQ